MTAVPTEHGWSETALFNKALVYVQKMEEHKTEDWEYGLYSSLSLELLCRAAIAHVSPTLLGDRSWRNIYHALGYPITSKAFTPTSRTTKEVLEILGEIIPLSKETIDFCSDHTSRRNRELHSGESGFVSVEAGKWLPKFYSACKTLLAFMDKKLENIFKDSAMAEQLIVASQDAAAKAVEQEIVAFKTMWESKTADERDGAARLAVAWATREKGHRAACPACGQRGVTRGMLQGEVTREVTDDDEIIQKQMAIPSSFECIACGLTIAGLSKLAACGLGTPFTNTSRSSPAEVFGLYTEDELSDALHSPPPFDEDNNE